MAVFGTLLVAAPALAMQQQGADSGTRTLPQTMPGELTLYEMTDYNGEAYVIDGPNSSVRTDWNIRSVAIHPGDRWQICARPRFRGDCIVLGRSVHDAALIGVRGQIGSTRPAPADGESD